MMIPRFTRHKFWLQQETFLERIRSRDVNVFIFFLNDDEKSKTKRSFLKMVVLKRSFLKTIVFQNDRFNKTRRFVNDRKRRPFVNDRFQNE